MYINIQDVFCYQQCISVENINFIYLLKIDIKPAKVNAGINNV